MKDLPWHQPQKGRDGRPGLLCQKTSHVGQKQPLDSGRQTEPERRPEVEVAAVHMFIVLSARTQVVHTVQVGPRILNIPRLYVEQSKRAASIGRGSAVTRLCYAKDQTAIATQAA